MKFFMKADSLIKYNAKNLVYFFLSSFSKKVVEMNGFNVDLLINEL